MTTSHQQHTLARPTVDEWDAFVRNHPRGHPLQLAAWGRLKAAFGWRAQPVVVRNQQVIVAGAQVLLRSRYGLSAAYVPRGPLFANEPQANNLLLQGLASLARRQRSIFLRLEPNVTEREADADLVHTRLLLNGYQTTAPIQPRSSIYLDLAAADDAALFASFSKGHRADIRRAERKGVDVRVGGADDIATFHVIMQDTGTRAGFGIHSAAYYRAAWAQFHPRSRLLLAIYEDEPVAGLLVVADSGVGLNLYAGANEAGLKTGANHLLQWCAMRWMRTQGCQHYDFWGIPDAFGRAATATTDGEREALETAAQSDPLIGMYRFKKGFGGRVVRYLPAYDRVFAPPLYALWRRRLAG